MTFRTTFRVKVRVGHFQHQPTKHVALLGLGLGTLGLGLSTFRVRVRAKHY